MLLRSQLHHLSWCRRRDFHSHLQQGLQCEREEGQRSAHGQCSVRQQLVITIIVINDPHCGATRLATILRCFSKLSTVGCSVAHSRKTATAIERVMLMLVRLHAGRGSTNCTGSQSACHILNCLHSSAPSFLRRRGL